MSGHKDGGLSSAQGSGGKSKAQSQVEVNEKTGGTSSTGQSSGANHSSQSEVVANEKGGLADAQSSGPGIKFFFLIQIQCDLIQLFFNQVKLHHKHKLDSVQKVQILTQAVIFSMAVVKHLLNQVYTPAKVNRRFKAASSN